MQRKIITSIFIIILAIFSLGASTQSEVKRMGIFISNFTEAGLFEFDLEEDGDPNLAHFGNPSFNGELIQFGITHNVINNSKSAIKKCPDKNCEYGPHIISGQSVSASIRRYFDMAIKNRSVSDAMPEIYYDGKNYHINASDWRPETVYYADVEEYSYKNGIITITGELYNLQNKKDRPATFTATAKPHTWNNKETWAILSLNVNWK